MTSKKTSVSNDNPANQPPDREVKTDGFLIPVSSADIDTKIDEVITGVSSDRAIYGILKSESYYLPPEKVKPVVGKMSKEVRERMLLEPRIRSNKATSLVIDLLSRHQSLREFMETRLYYKDFKRKAKKMGLNPDFDKWPKEYAFEVPASSGSREEFAELNGFLRETAADLFYPVSRNEEEEMVISGALQTDLDGLREKLAQLKPSSPEFMKNIFRYYETLHVLAKRRNLDLVKKIGEDVADNNQLSALSRINEFYRDKIGNETIALEPDRIIKSALNIILDETLKGTNQFFSRFNLSKLEATAGKKISYSLKMDPRDADSLCRGMISSDCTDIRNDFAFHETVPQHLLDPGFNCFRLYEEGRWVGNVYWMVATVNGEPAIIIDAVQTSEQHVFKADTTDIADKIIEMVKTYQKETGFKKVYLSRFISNRGLLNFYLGRKYPSLQHMVEKVGGFRHLKDLKLWDESAFRNEYIETIMPGNPNLEIQKLPLRDLDTRCRKV